MLNSAIPTKFPLRWGQNAGGAYIRSIPTASQIGIQDGAASLNDGFPPLTCQPIASGGKPPWGQDHNGILNQITAWNQWQQAGAAVQYDSSFSTSIGGYPKGAILASTATTGLFWYNAIDNNTTNPDSGGVSWEATGPAANLLHYATDSGTANNVSTTTILPSVAITTGMLIQVLKMSSANTGAMTGTIKNISGADILWTDGTALRPNDWPASSIGLLYYDGTAFRLLTSFVRASAIQPSVNMTFYVNGSTGNDSNDGLTSGTAFATIPGAITAITSRYLALNSATVNIANGTYTAFTVPSSLVANWIFTGNISTPASCVLSAASTAVNSGRGIIASKNTSVSIQGFSFSTNLENIDSIGGSVTVLGNCAFSGPSNSNYPCVSANAGTINVYGTNTYTGGMSAFAQSSFGAIVNLGYTDAATTNSLTLTAVSSPGFVTGFAVALSAGTLNVYRTVDTFSGSATGPRFSSTLNGIINTFGGGSSYLPGNSAGSTATGGQYA